MTAKAHRVFNMVLAVLVSIGAWVFVVYNYYPMTEVRYSDVPVECTGEDALADRGLAVSEISLEGVTVTLNQKRIDAGRISADDIKISADVSGCVAGENSVPLTVTGPADTTVTATDAEGVNVSIGRAKSDVMDIDVIYAEGADEEAEPIAFDMSVAEARVISTADNLGKIYSVAAMLEPEAVKENVKSFTVKLKALDRDGNILPHVVVEPDEVSLDACSGVTKEVSLTVPVRNGTDDDYERTYKAPDKVTIKGSEEAVSKVGTIRAFEIDISDVYEDIELPIEYNLPEGIYIANESLQQTLSVSVSEKQQSDGGD